MLAAGDAAKSREADWPENWTRGWRCLLVRHWRQRQNRHQHHWPRCLVRRIPVTVGLSSGTDSMQVKSNAYLCPALQQSEQGCRSWMGCHLCPWPGCHP